MVEKRTPCGRTPEDVVVFSAGDKAGRAVRFQRTCGRATPFQRNHPIPTSSVWAELQKPRIVIPRDYFAGCLDHQRTMADNVEASVLVWVWPTAPQLPLRASGPTAMQGRYFLQTSTR